MSASSHSRTASATQQQQQPQQNQQQQVEFFAGGREAASQYMPPEMASRYFSGHQQAPQMQFGPPVPIHPMQPPGQPIHPAILQSYYDFYHRMIQYQMFIQQQQQHVMQQQQQQARFPQEEQSQEQQGFQAYENSEQQQQQEDQEEEEVPVFHRNEEEEQQQHLQTPQQPLIVAQSSGETISVPNRGRQSNQQQQQFRGRGGFHRGRGTGFRGRGRGGRGGDNKPFAVVGDTQQQQQHQQQPQQQNVSESVAEAVSTTFTPHQRGRGRGAYRGRGGGGASRGGRVFNRYSLQEQQQQPQEQENPTEQEKHSRPRFDLFERVRYAIALKEARQQTFNELLVQPDHLRDQLEENSHLFNSRTGRPHDKIEFSFPRLRHAALVARQGLEKTPFVKDLDDVLKVTIAPETVQAALKEREAKTATTSTTKEKEEVETKDKEEEIKQVAKTYSFSRQHFYADWDFQEEVRWSTFERLKTDQAEYPVRIYKADYGPKLSIGLPYAVAPPTQPEAEGTNKETAPAPPAPLAPESTKQ